MDKRTRTDQKRQEQTDSYWGIAHYIHHYTTTVSYDLFSPSLWANNVVTREEHTQNVKKRNASKGYLKILL